MKNSEPRQRSEKIRRKLSEESQQNIRQASKRLMDIPAVDQINKNFFLKSEGLQTSSASAQKKRFRPGWRILSLAICIFVSYTLFNIWQSPQYVIEHIEILGLQRLEAEVILSTIELEGSHILTFDAQSIKEKISAAFPELRQTTIRVEFPSQVSILTVERQPIIRWLAETNSIWIDGEGYLIPVRGDVSVPLTIQSTTLPAYTLQVPPDELSLKKIVRDKEFFLPGIPEFTFFSTPKKINDELLTAILQLNAWMPEEKILLHQKQRGLGWHDARGWDVYVGQKLEKINDKMVMYQMIVRELESQGINPTLVSVEFLHAPYYRTGE